MTTYEQLLVELREGGMSDPHVVVAPHGVIGMLCKVIDEYREQIQQHLSDHRVWADDTAAALEDAELQRVREWLR